MSTPLRFSLGANLLLAGIVAALLWRNPPFASPPAVPAAIPPGVAAPQGPSAEPAAARPPRAGTGLTPDTIALLEQHGISRRMLAGAVIEEHDRQTARRALELQKRHAPLAVPAAEMRALARKENEDQVRELKAVLGEEGYRDWDKEQVLRALNRARLPGDELPLSAAEAEAAYRLQKAFDEQNQGFQEAMEDGVSDRADIGALQAQAQQALDRELEQLLGRQRFNELRGNVDPATEVYRTYGGLSPTPAQADAVLRAEAAYRAQEAALGQRAGAGDAATLAAELKTLADARDAELGRIFGAEAYAGIKRQNDPAYQTLRQYAEAWELQEGDINAVYQTLHAFNDQAERTRGAATLHEAAGQPVNWPAINAAIEQARRQAEAEVGERIGADRLRRLEQNGLLAGP